MPRITPKESPRNLRLIGYHGLQPIFRKIMGPRREKRITGPGNKVYKNRYNHPTVEARTLTVNGIPIND